MSDLIDEPSFVGFMLAKSYDVLSDCSFKRHLIQSRDRGDAWAVGMHAQLTRITAACKRVQTLIIAMQDTPQHRDWAMICRDVMASASPPVKVFTGRTQCHLTAAGLDHSLDLSKAGKNAKDIRVHLRFFYFFLYIWLISKIEYVIRSSVKSWLEPEPERDSPADSDTPASPANRDITSDIANRDITRDIANRDITGLCERFRVENEALIGSFARLFVRAYAYVTASIDLYKQEFDIAPVLRPTPESLNKLE